MEATAGIRNPRIAVAASAGKEEALAYIELTTDADNIASRRVIEANGGELIERFHKPAEYGGAESLRFRILLAKTAA